MATQEEMSALIEQQMETSRQVLASIEDVSLGGVRDQFVVQLTEAKEALQGIKAAYAKLRKERRPDEIAKLTSRVPFVDIPDALVKALDALAGSNMILFTLIEDLQEQISSDNEDMDDDEAGGALDLDLESLNEVKAGNDKLIRVLEFVTQLQDAPEEIAREAAELLKTAQEAANAIGEEIAEAIAEIELHPFAEGDESSAAPEQEDSAALPEENPAETPAAHPQDSAAPRAEEESPDA